MAMVLRNFGIILKKSFFPKNFLFLKFISFKLNESQLRYKLLMFKIL